MSKAPSTGSLAAAAFIGLLAGQSLPALAQVHKCTQTDGSISFQSAPCAASDAAPPQRVTAAQLNAARRAQEQARARAEAASHAASPSSRPHAPGKQKPSVASPCRKMPASSPPRSASAPAPSPSTTKPC